MAVHTDTQLITGEMLLAMGDVGPCELVAGRIIPLSPGGEPHGKFEGNFYVVIRAFVIAHKLGEVRVGEVGFYTRRNPDTVRGADVLYISKKRFAQRQSSGFLDVAPDLVVEIMSPANTWREMTTKLEEYFNIGVRLVWIADPPSKHIYAYRSMTDVRTFTITDNLPGDDVLPGFLVPVIELLSEMDTPN